jgi:hypothetical protein
METVVVYNATDELLANSVRDLLLQNGIGAMVRPRHFAAYGVLVPDLNMSGIWGEVLVYDKDMERAEELIAGFLGTLGLLAEAELSDAELEAQALVANPEP